MIGGRQRFLGRLGCQESLSYRCATKFPLAMKSSGLWAVQAQDVCSLRMCSGIDNTFLLLRNLERANRKALQFALLALNSVVVVVVVV